MPLAAGRDQFVSEVVENRLLCREHYLLALRLPEFPATEPGQFVQVACRDTSTYYSPEREADWSEGRPFDPEGVELMAALAYLRRPFSLAGRTDGPDGVLLELIQRTVGVGTHWLATLKPGDRVDVFGPLGNRFRLPAEDEIALLVGGGVGIPPMLYLAERLVDRPAVAFAGALTRDLLPFTFTDDVATAPDDVTPRLNVAEFARYGVPTVLATDDGSQGFRGFVTQALEKYLDTHPSKSPPTIYTCGPEPMMRRVADIAAARNLECQVAVERAMACGMGTCQSCCIRVKKPDPSLPPLAGRDWCWRLACTDGPVFKGADLLW
jgi:dihydroorotate dehydrogenase electron transfer subunit